MPAPCQPLEYSCAGLIISVQRKRVATCIGGAPLAGRPPFQGDIVTAGACFADSEEDLPARYTRPAKLRYAFGMPPRAEPTTDEQARLILSLAQLPSESTWRLEPDILSSARAVVPSTFI